MQTGKVSGVAVVGIPDPLKGSEIIAACVTMQDIEPSDDLAEEFIHFITQSLGKSFKPKRILFVNDLPKTRNMKIMRRAVKAALTGQSLGDTSSLVNPESLDEISRVAINTDIGK